MPQVIVLDNLRDTRLFIETAVSSDGKRDLYLSLSGQTEVEHFLQSRGFTSKILSNKTEEHKTQFVRNYVDLIGNMTRIEHQTRLWWATNMASKNRFVSALAQHLQEFTEVIEAVEEGHFDRLVLIGPSWLILPSVRKFLRKKNIGFICPNYSFRKWRDIILNGFRKVASNVYHGIRVYSRACYARICLKRSLLNKIKQDHPYYVIRSFVYDHSLDQDGCYQDPFFGRLPEFLADKRNILIFSDILGDYRFCVQRIKRCRSAVIVPCELFLSFWDVVKALGQILFCGIKVPDGIKFLENDVADMVRNELVRTHNGIAIYQYLQYANTKKLLQHIAVDQFLLTFENNPWEKMTMMAVRQFSPGTRIIGYQHNVVPQASANMFMSALEHQVIPKPDRILTTGIHPKDIMRRYGSFDGVSFDVACALRHEYLFRLKPSQRPDEHRAILLALEGIFDAYHMVNYVLDQLSESQEFKVRIRTHPVLPLKAFEHKLKLNLKQMGHVCSSKGTTLKEDIEASDIVIYWGSTVALEALWMGKPVIHFDNGNILSFDPLFDCSHLKWTVSRDKDLKSVLKEIDLLDPEEYEHQKTEAKAYLQHYFYPVTDENLSHFLA